MPGNKHRGEVELKLGGHSFVLRPDFTALSQIEAVTGKSIYLLARSWADSSLMLRDIAAIITEGMKAAGEPAQYAKVGEMLVEHGFADGAIQLAVVTFLKNGLEGGLSSDSAGEAKATDRQTP